MIALILKDPQSLSPETQNLTPKTQHPRPNTALLPAVLILFLIRVPLDSQPNQPVNQVGIR
jgi:hypothetical protein